MNDRIRGALLGTMVGDALGAPFEGTPRTEAPRLAAAIARRIAEPRGWGHTDDTEMAACLGESIVRGGGVDEARALDAMCEGHEPARGYGKGTRAAFREWRRSRDWRSASRAAWSEGSRGNGAAARIAPVAIHHRHHAIGELEAGVAASARPTHAHPEAIEGALVIGLAVWLALRGADRLAIVERVATGRSSSYGALGRAATAGSSDFLGAGVLAVESVPAALWAFASSDRFEDAVVRAVGLGGDTDTIGAMAGAIAGARHGAAAIPEAWIAALPPVDRERMERLAQSFCAR